MLQRRKLRYRGDIRAAQPKSERVFRCSAAPCTVLGDGEMHGFGLNLPSS